MQIGSMRRRRLILMQRSILRCSSCDVTLPFSCARFRGLSRYPSSLSVAKANSMDMDRPTMPVLSLVCTSCRARHVRCSGPPVCSRCTRDGTACEFRPSRRGQRGPLNQVVSGSELSSGSSTTCVLCRERHLKCSGGPVCSRCEAEKLPCTFRPR